MLDMRSCRGPNNENMQDTYGPDAYFLGPTQIAWLKRELLNSKATWKVISADMSISLVVVYDTARRWGFEAVSNRDNGTPRGKCRCRLSPSGCSCQFGRRSAPMMP
jgi:alkaline phosphatase D